MSLIIADKGSTLVVFVGCGFTYKCSTELTLAGNRVMQDVAVAFRLSVQEAEKVVRKHGTVFPKLVNDKRQFAAFPLVIPAEETHSCKALAEVIHSRVEEILITVTEYIRSVNNESIENSENIGVGDIILEGKLFEIAGVVELLISILNERSIDFSSIEVI